MADFSGVRIFSDAFPWALLETAPIGSSISFAVDMRSLPVSDVVELESALKRLATRPNGALLVMPDTFTTANRELIGLAAECRLPALYPYRFFATSGGLVSYGVDTVDQYPRAAVYADRILKGEKPAELPIQQPTKYELVINLKTAKALGLDIPPSLLASADEVIE